MKFTVDWRPRAEQKLADIWNNAADRAAITGAADYIDFVLERDPLTAGESRPGNIRILIERPLAVYYRVDRKNNEVLVLSVWRVI
jgi:plasmid stabilization system protein ParE